MNIQKNQIPVVIFCGGRGTRLKEETEIVPKPLVRIGDKPILWHIMKIFCFYGFKRFVLAAGYKAEKIKEYFVNYTALQGDFTVDFSNEKKLILHTPIKEQWKVTIVDTGLDAQTGARIKRLESYLDNDLFLMTYGDGVANVNIDELLKFHLSHGKMATVTGVHPSARFGEITVENDIAVNFWEKPQLREGYVNGGFFVLNKSILELLNNEENLNFEKDILPEIVQKRELAVFRHEGYWQCMDTIRDLEVLQEEWAKDKPKWKVWTK